MKLLVCICLSFLASALPEIETRWPIPSDVQGFQLWCAHSWNQKKACVSAEQNVQEARIKLQEAFSQNQDTFIPNVLSGRFLVVNLEGDDKGQVLYDGTGTGQIEAPVDFRKFTRGYHFNKNRLVFADKVHITGTEDPRTEETTKPRPVDANPFVVPPELAREEPFGQPSTFGPGAFGQPSAFGPFGRRLLQLPSRPKGPPQRPAPENSLLNFPPGERSRNELASFAASSGSYGTALDLDDIAQMYEQEGDEYKRIQEAREKEWKKGRKHPNSKLTLGILIFPAMVD